MRSAAARLRQAARRGLLALALAAFVLPTAAQDAAQENAPVDDPLVGEVAPRAVAADTAFAPRTRTDSLIQSDLRTLFGTIPAMEGIEVHVCNRVVLLDGDVVDLATSTDAIALAQQADSVRYVVDSVAADVEVEARLAPAIQRVQDYVSSFIATLPLLGVALLVFVVFAFISLLIGRMRNPIPGTALSPILQNLVRRILRLVVLVVGVLLFLDILGITALVGALLGAAGLVGVAVGFAFQDIAENYLAGLLLSIRQPFNLGDTVRIGEHEGRVVKLTARELLMMSYEGNHVRLPNATVFKSDLVNFTRNPNRRFGFKAGIDVEEDLREVQRIGLQTLNAMRGVLEDPPPFMWIEELGDSNVVVGFYGWIDQREVDFMKVRSEALRLVKRALDEAQILMPEPIFNLKVHELTQAPGEPPERAKTPTEPKAPRKDVYDDARTADVYAEDPLDAQIRDDLRDDPEQNLLRP
jgi:small-conductance mechanosensitive channel